MLSLSPPGRRAEIKGHFRALEPKNSASHGDKAAHSREHPQQQRWGHFKGLAMIHEKRSWGRMQDPAVHIEGLRWVEVGRSRGPCRAARGDRRSSRETVATPNYPRNKGQGFRACAVVLRWRFAALSSAGRRRNWVRGGPAQAASLLLTFGTPGTKNADRRLGRTSAEVLQRLAA